MLALAEAAAAGVAGGRLKRLELIGLWDDPLVCGMTPPGSSRTWVRRCSVISANEASCQMRPHLSSWLEGTMKCRRRRFRPPSPPCSAASRCLRCLFAAIVKLDCSALARTAPAGNMVQRGGSTAAALADRRGACARERAAGACLFVRGGPDAGSLASDPNLPALRLMELTMSQKDNRNSPHIGPLAPLAAGRSGGAAGGAALGEWRVEVEREPKSFRGKCGSDSSAFNNASN